MRFSGKKILVVGLARTGIAVARYASEKGAKVTVTDIKTKSELEAPLKLLSGVKNIKYELGKHSLSAFLSSDFIIVSPGVPSQIIPLEKARAKHIPILSELEFASRFVRQPIIAVTGTNGKTTTTMIVGQMLKNAKKNVFVGGNIGNALTNMLLTKEKYDTVVCEVSSFQLELAEKFHPKVAIILNLTPDHLDRHQTLENYRAIKGRIFKNQLTSDSLILNANDPLVASYGAESQSQVFYFKIGKLGPAQEGIYYEGNRFHLKTTKFEKEVFGTSMLKIKGDHNKENFMASILAAKLLKCSSAAIQGTIDTFEGVAHRLEYVKTRGYVEFYNDSKATNVDSVKRALESFDKPLILIMGGRDKGGNFEDLRSIVQKKVKTLVLMGEAKEKINRAIGDYTETFVVGTLEEAVFMAYQKSRAGDVILFSPGCASFDMFKNYEERGDRFKDLLRDL